MNGLQATLSGTATDMLTDTATGNHPVVLAVSMISEGAVSTVLITTNRTDYKRYIPDGKDIPFICPPREYITKITAIGADGPTFTVNPLKYWNRGDFVSGVNIPR